MSSRSLLSAILVSVSRCSLHRLLVPPDTALPLRSSLHDLTPMLCFLRADMYNVVSLMFILGSVGLGTFTLEVAMAHIRADLLLTLVLTLVALKLVTNERLPQITYLTWLDYYVLLTLMFQVTQLACNFYVALAYVRANAATDPADQEHELEELQKADRIILWVLVSFWAGMHVCLWVLITWWRRTTMGLLDRSNADWELLQKQRAQDLQKERGNIVKSPRRGSSPKAKAFFKAPSINGRTLKSPKLNRIFAKRLANSAVGPLVRAQNKDGNRTVINSSFTGAHAERAEEEEEEEERAKAEELRRARARARDDWKTLRSQTVRKIGQTNNRGVGGVGRRSSAAVMRGQPK